MICACMQRALSRSFVHTRKDLAFLLLSCSAHMTTEGPQTIDYMYMMICLLHWKETAARSTRSWWLRRGGLSCKILCKEHGSFSGTCCCVSLLLCAPAKMDLHSTPCYRWIYTGSQGRNWPDRSGRTTRNIYCAASCNPSFVRVYICLS